MQLLQCLLNIKTQPDKLIDANKHINTITPIFVSINNNLNEKLLSPLAQRTNCLNKLTTNIIRININNV